MNKGSTFHFTILSKPLLRCRNPVERDKKATESDDANTADNQYLSKPKPSAVSLDPLTCVLGKHNVSSIHKNLVLTGKANAFSLILFLHHSFSSQTCTVAEDNVTNQTLS